MTDKILERNFQPILIKAIEDRFPGAIVLKNDTSRKAGFPDLTVLYKRWYAVLEVKRSKPSEAAFQANQTYYVDLLSEWSYAAVVYPENFDTVLQEMETSYKEISRGVVKTSC